MDGSLRRRVQEGMFSARRPLLSVVRVMIDQMNDPKSSRSSPLAAGGAATTSATATVVSLKSLAPHYVESQHGTYLRRLNEAIEDSRNRNIALTGRYGTGKSSILDKFHEMHEK